MTVAGHQRVGGSQAASVHSTKTKLFVTDGSDVALKGICCIFIRNDSSIAITDQNIAQVSTPL